MKIEGLDAFQADYESADKTITLNELIAYGVDRVNKLYEELKKGNLSTTFSRGEASRASVVQPVDINKILLGKKILTRSRLCLILPENRRLM